MGPGPRSQGRAAAASIGVAGAPRALRRLSLVALAVTSLCAAAPAVASAASCAPPAPGGDWPLYGHDLANTRDQPSATGLGPAHAPSLKPLWSFYIGTESGPVGGGLSDLNATPTEAGGCVYFGTGVISGPNVFALNADTGAVVWSAHLDAGSTGGIGGAIPGSLTYVRGTLYVLVNELGDGSSTGPYVAALDAASGALKWRSAPIVTGSGYYTNATPTVAGGVIVAGFSAPEGNPYGHGGVGLLDARTGKLLSVSYTIPPSQWGTAADPKYAGGGVWTTPAVDLKGGYAYYGTGNPYSKQIEYGTTNAIVKLDIDRRRATFGQIVASDKGTLDQGSQLVYTLAGPTCSVLPDDPLASITLPGTLGTEIGALTGNSIGCVQLDLDFGAAPNLFRSAAGQLLVGDLQKSGVYHVADAETMSPAWMATVGASCEVCNGSSTAYDPAARALFADASPGSLMESISNVDGSLNWLAPVADAFHYESVSVADGVVYTMDGLGFLDAFDEATGLELLRRPMVLDGGADALPPGGNNSSGVAIARNTVYVESGSHVIAYR